MAFTPYSARRTASTSANPVVYMHVTKGMSYEDIADTFWGRPSKVTVRRICREWALTGNTIKHGRDGIRHASRKMDEVSMALLADAVQQRSDSLLHELAARLCDLTGDPTWLPHDVCRGLHEMGYVRLKITKEAAEASARHQALFVEEIGQLSVGADAFVFIDEVAAVRACARHLNCRACGVRR